MSESYYAFPTYSFPTYSFPTYAFPGMVSSVGSVALSDALWGAVSITDILRQSESALVTDSERGTVTTTEQLIGQL